MAEFTEVFKKRGRMCKYYRGCLECPFRIILFREDCNRYHEWGMHEGYEDGYAKGGSDMEKAKQIIIDSLLEQIPKWHLVKIRPLTEEEKEYYGEDCDFIYDCETPDSDQEVLVATKWGVDKTTYCTDCGCYFENYEDEGEVIAWMELPKFSEVE